MNLYAPPTIHNEKKKKGKIVLLLPSFVLLDLFGSEILVLYCEKLSWTRFSNKVRPTEKNVFVSAAQKMEGHRLTIFVIN